MANGNPNEPQPQGKPAASSQEITSIDQWCSANGYDGVTKECLISASQQADPKVVQMAKEFMAQQIGQQAMSEGEQAPGGPAKVGPPGAVRVGPKPGAPTPVSPGGGKVKVKKPGGY